MTLNLLSGWLLFLDVGFVDAHVRLAQESLTAQMVFRLGHCILALEVADLLDEVACLFAYFVELVCYLIDDVRTGQPGLL